jgi:integrase
MVDAGIIDGKRVRRTFSSLADAEAEGDRLRAERNAKSQTAKFEAANRAVSLAKLSDAQRGDVLAALRALSGRGTLTGAVDFFLKHAAPESARSVAEIIAELLAAVRASGRRPRTVAELKWRLEVFGKRFGAVPIMSVTPRDIEAWIAERTAGAGPVTRDNERRGLFRLFAFAVKRNYAERNPVASLERTTIDASATPSIHTPDEVQKVLAAVATHAPRMIPYYAIGYFAGLRPENELRGLHWTDIDFKSGLVHVRPETAKKRRERYVDLAPNLAAWLAPHRKESGPITYTHYSFKKVRKSCGVKWSPDVMRHTFATMHFAANNDAPRTAAQLGHSGNPGVLFNHYRRLIRPDVAEAFWKLMPPTPGGVISIGRKDKQAAG